MRVLVTGGTGTLGRAIMTSALAKRMTLRMCSRQPRPDNISDDIEWAACDFVTGRDLAEGLAGVEAIIHAASDPRRVDEVDIQGTARLIDAARRAGVAHLIYISIVGINAIPYAYYQRKVEVESIVMNGGLPWTVLRTTQFHPFIDALLSAAARVPLVLPLPAGFVVQSVAVEEVADRLLHAALDGPGGRLRDFGGPEVLSLRAMARAWKAARGVRKPIVSVPLFGRTAAAFRAGRNTVANGNYGMLTWEEWLERSPGSTSYAHRR